MAKCLIYRSIFNHKVNCYMIADNAPTSAPFHRNMQYARIASFLLDQLNLHHASSACIQPFFFYRNALKTLYIHVRHAVWSKLYFVYVDVQPAETILIPKTLLTSIYNCSAWLTS